MHVLHANSTSLAQFLRQIDQMLVDHMAQSRQPHGFPPYDIHGIDDKGHHYRLTLALAGFRPEDVKVYIEDRQLVIEGASEVVEPSSYRAIHKGIAARTFRRNFPLTDSIEVGHATFKNGLLTIDLNRIVPDSLKPRSIPVQTTDKAPASEPAEHVLPAEPEAA